ncbi:hypothetical protein KSP39_PZI020409 [Platanthera zijinensis]|uniref:Outer arm dynein light chain 1 protein n=1 Tax=Platanthera zijinensis TaxID=2320716 RepID=A0AAP0B0R8_9ASPA
MYKWWLTHEQLALCEVSCPIVKLVLRNNALTTLRGIEHLKLVEGLDLSYNLISKFSEMEILANLPRLQNLWLEGNPICYARWYRAYVYSFFFHPERLILDDYNISTIEYWEIHIIIYTSRQKQPPAYGFYFPAKDPVEEDCCALANKKKYSRLASIEDGEQRRHLFMEAIEKDTVSCDTEMFRKDEITTPDHDPKVIGLMNKVEHMKKERSVLWLRDLKDWMDQIPEDLIDRSQQIDFNLDDSSDQSLEPLVDAEHFRESSQSVEGMKHAEGGGSISSLLTSESPGNSNLDRKSRTAMEPYAANDERYFVAALKSHKVISEQDRIKDDSMNLENLSPLILNGNSGISSSAAGGREYSELSINSARLTAIDEIIGSHSSSTFPGSPPHYQEDILHRRLYLEEEFLHLSSTSRFVDLSDSDSSYSDDESCGSRMSMSENDSTCIQDSTVDSSDHVVDHANNYLGNEHEKSYFTESNIPVCEHHAKLSSNKELSSNNHVDAAISCTSSCLNEDAGVMERINCKQQLKRGFVSLFGNLLPCNSLQECKKVNRALDSHRFDMKDVQGQSCYSAFCFSSGRMNGKVLRLRNGAEAGCTFRYDSKEQNECLKDFFNSNIADSKTSERCQQIVFCGCIYKLASVSFESEVALLKSCKNKLYLLRINETDGLGTVSSVLGCYGLDEISEIVTGLGLQALRVNMEKDVTYLFLPRTIEMCKDLFSLLEVYGLSSSTIKCSLKTWEQIQVDLLEKYISGGLKTGIYFYSMILFWPDKCEENSWLSRSMFVIKGYIVVCTENLKQFGSQVHCHGNPPYYTFDLLCPIQNILEMVIESEEDGRCLTLIAANVQLENIFIADKNSSVRQESRRSCKWKFKWFSEDYLSKFVSLLKAMHSSASAPPLHVKCPS